MADSDPLYAQRDRADSFGAVARAYDAHRPRYPDEVIDDIAAAAGGGLVLDVGAGTGIASAQLADRGLEVLALEPDAAMAEVAAAKGISVEQGTFERWDAAGRTFDLILFAQSWHWVDTAVAIPTAMSLLNPGGRLVLLWHMTNPESPSAEEFDAVYRRYTPATAPRGSSDDVSLADALTAGGFTVTEKTYPVRADYTTDDWLDMVFTFSAQIVLPEADKVSLRSDLAALVGPDGVTVAGVAYVATATAPTRPVHTDRRLALSFGAEADNYERHRPDFPAEMMDAVAELGSRVLDVGTGTGKAAAALVARGCEVLGVEPDPQMAAIARAKGVVVEEGTFEQWDPDGRQFDLVVFARSWHWVDPEVALPRLATIVPVGGHVALLAHEASWRTFDDPRIRAVIERVVPLGDTAARRATDEVVARFTAAGFDVRTEEFPMTQSVSTQEWLDSVFTYSRFLVLDEATRTDLRHELIDAIGTSEITVSGTPRAMIARRR
ncbi:methyltransferase domain-containing protein [Williamsia herbipolensis]|uniref:methyltransferase domain-containing protein n=1 Tax=Williamsia herbipolensis TaxID=1603258 RepID=UPI0006971A67|nr:methyltransferase domain-containing protein [Williamsia herbipolensis]